MMDFIAVTRTHLQALIDAAQADTATPSDAQIIVKASQELASHVAKPNPTADDVRNSFEQACKSSKAYSFPLGVVKLNGAFRNYMDSDTDSAYVGYRAGFVRGLKWHQQLAQVNVPAEAQPQLPTESSQPSNASLEALRALLECSWLDPDPCDSSELEAAKTQAREAIKAASSPS
ncbi:hypothetical protein NPS53_09170 [Pseudomonas putida]|uniref:hypothetical protein n=1 Tax=Pseudomonas putida TaxID=303 RepID=UPI0023643286|nr:hypothetical protein [Pseudomonas putida]MDD2139746.1 hypothetical protein [Pseudomonas putida]HDS1721670.1 hypothetical protein [Pseudomonas putida]